MRSHDVSLNNSKNGGIVEQLSDNLLYIVKEMSSFLVGHFNTSNLIDIKITTEKKTIIITSLHL